MIKIALCDDIPVQLTMVTDMVSSWLEERGIQAQISSFKSGTDLLKTVDTKGYFDIYILDMIMPGIQGIELGTELRNRGDNGKIIYLTATSAFAVESYKVQAFFYLLKPLSKKQLDEVLDMAVKEIIIEDSNINNRHVEIKTKDGKIVVPVSEILYIDIVNRGLCFHMSDKSAKEGPMLRTTFIDATKDIVDEDTFTIVGSHIAINISNVETADKSSIRFNNGETIFPSKATCSEVYKRLTT